jgi:F-type H+-transporting ATPase subunit gamma
VAIAREVKRRIRSVENTAQITRTMEMVATSKLKRASDRVQAARPYGRALEEIVRSLHNPEFADRFPLLRTPEETKRVAVLLLTANRGLAGAFNVNLIRRAKDLLKELRAKGTDVELHVSGKKGIAFFRFQGEKMVQTWTDVSDAPSPDDAGRLISSLQSRFESGELDGVWVVASEYRSALSTPPIAKQVLPIGGRATGKGAAGGHGPGGTGAAGTASGKSGPDNFILSPSADDILNKLLPLFVRNVIYRALVENAAAEQGSRRTAMKNATDNASDMLDGLRRTYNRARQGQITQEIAEIVGGAAAFE